MSYIAQRLWSVARRPPISLVNNITKQFRALSVTTCTLQQKPGISLANVPTVVSAAEQKECQQVFDNVNQQLAAGTEGRLFAVVHLCGKQFKITAGDIILVEGYWPPNIGDVIRLEKVLLAGGRDFTLIGRPALERGLVNVNATIIEKTLAHTKTHFRKKRRKQYMRINFQRSPNTMIRINSIEVAGKVDDANKSEDSDKRIF